MGASNGKTKRSIERGKGGTRNTGAQTSRQEAQALELIRRAFSSSDSRLWDDIPDRDGGRYKDAWFDREVLQRGNVNTHWPYPDADTSWPKPGNSNWGSEMGRRVEQGLESEMKNSWERWNGKGRQPSAMSAGHVFNRQQWQPDVPSDYNDSPTLGTGDALSALLKGIFGR